MRLISVVSAILVVFSMVGATGTLHPVPPIPDGEVRVLRLRYENPKHTPEYFASRHLNLRILHEEAASSIKTEAQYKGEGKNRRLVWTRTETLHNRAVSVNKFDFAPGEHLILRSYDHKVTTPAGKLVRHEIYDYSDPIFHYPKDIHHPYTIEVLMRSLPLEVGYKIGFHLVINPKAVMRMWLEVEKEEVVQAPAGNIECYRVEMSPNLEDFMGKAGKVLQPITPKYTFWAAKKGTHPMVKYRGPLGEINLISAPIEIHELVSIKPGL